MLRWSMGEAAAFKLALLNFFTSRGPVEMDFQLIYTLILISVVALAAFAYGIRVFINGRAKFSRVDKQGGSALLSKSVMEGAYWFLQPFGRLLVFCHVTPNQISWASLFFGIVAGTSLVFGHFGSAAAFATVSALLDSLDGMVARMTGVASDAGEVLDAAADRYVEFFFLGGLAVYYREIPTLMILTLIALMGSFMVSYSTAKAEALHVDPPKGSMRRPERALYLILGAALSPVTIPIFEQDRDFTIAIGHPMVIAVSLVAVLANLSAIERLYAIAKAMRVREAEARREALAAAMAGSEEAEDQAAAEAHSRLQ
jgi:CDP-diacylglycerol--glycerol-3-phosphate 3-phosphatidyltransferase